LGRYEEAIISFIKALSYQTDNYYVWNYRGAAEYKLGRYTEAIVSLDTALNCKPDYHYSFYNKACCYALQSNVEQALENLKHAINLSPQTYREMAKTDSDFEPIRRDPRFVKLMRNTISPQAVPSRPISKGDLLG
jgi:tetratricopeptide (TPR) repeat protein